MEMKNAFLDLKSTGTTGTFSGLLSTYGPPADLGGDVIGHGAFSKTLAETRGRLPLLLAHDGTKQLGLVKLTDSEVGLRAEGLLNMESSLAQEIHSNMRFNLAHGIPCALSIGYIPIKSTPQKDGTRLLVEVRLKEASYTLTPMNERALISTAKHTRCSELDQLLATFQSKLDSAVGRSQLSNELQATVNSFERRVKLAAGL